jgi:anaerobic magnesium-protoporphyrin IX monomethyl ester cyclase
VFPPLGLAYIAAVLVKNGHDVEIIDALGIAHKKYTYYKDNIYIRGLNVNDIVEMIKNRKPELIGISNMYSFAYPIVNEIVDAIKLIISVPIVAGGAHPSIETERILKTSKIDFIVIGEGEYSFLNLVKSLQQKNPLDSIKNIDGLGYKIHEKIIINPKTQFIKNLDELPFPKLDLLPMNKYFEAKEAHGSVIKERWVPIISSRGCPYNCAFCGTVAIWHRLWRPRSAKNVVDEIESDIKTWGIEEVHFNDENMTVDGNRLREICRDIIKRKLKIAWQVPNGVRTERLDKETLMLMKKSGCYHITVAPENASKKVLKLMNKKIDLEHIIRVVKWCKELGIKTAAYFILGFPGETRADINITLRYSQLLARCGLDEVVYSLFTPLPGSKIAEKFTDVKYFDYLSMADLSRLPAWYGPDKKYLKNIRTWMYAKFYLTKYLMNPISLVKFLKNLVLGKQETKTERTILQILNRK